MTGTHVTRRQKGRETVASCTSVSTLILNPSRIKAVLVVASGRLKTLPQPTTKGQGQGNGKDNTGPALAYVLCIPQNVQLFTADMAGDANAHKEALPKFLREER